MQNLWMTQIRMMIRRRRLCLRIKDLTKKTNERANNVLEKVREQFKEAKLEIPGAVLDRPHTFCRINNYVIVHLLHLDTKFYLITTAKNKKTKIFTLISQNHNFLYLLRPRYLLRITKKLLFCYEDINSRCKLRHTDEIFFQITL